MWKARQSPIMSSPSSKVFNSFAASTHFLTVTPQTHPLHADTVLDARHGCLIFVKWLPLTTAVQELGLVLYNVIPLYHLPSSVQQPCQMNTLFYPHLRGECCGFPGGSDGKESACNTGDPGSIPELGWPSGEGNGNPQPTPVILPGESHGQRSLVGYTPWGRKELDMTEVT